MELTGIVANGHVEFEHPCTLPEGTRVTIRIEERADSKQPTTPTTLGKRLMTLAEQTAGIIPWAGDAASFDHILAEAEEGEPLP